MSAHAYAYEHESGPPIEHGRLGVWLFIAGETMFFAGLFAAWLVLRGGAPDWPVAPRVELWLGLVFTAVLGLASLAAGAAARAARRGDTARLVRWLGVTALMGAVFLGGQAYEYSHLFRQGIAPRTDVAWGMFFVITGAHGAHVLVGALWNLALTWRAWRGHVPRWRARYVEYAAAYQHFVDAVWLGVFTALYVVG
jgi:cytochrome c oxidase subunit 3